MSESKPDLLQAECAARVMDVVPTVMRWVRAEMRGQRMSDLSVPQFRTLLLLERKPGVSLSDVAEHLGLSLPSASKTIDRLVERKLVTRVLHTEDRRYISLTLTPSGQDALQAARSNTEARMAEMLAGLTHDQLDTLARAMDRLREVFGPTRSRASQLDK